ncbi:hypothetical protein SAMN04515647_1627 [Cohaesibacter sp. ES.047]|uniref:hypothetical protein n=1 Tax=Cohaesibacter sp. ES.047 TaxID=1798205 RepID=UPI000BB858C5|nr:hypothetical protein [Cohaesibacter sp. ES.047]SNY91405.1 hypothetical protein SAMN04515647_1627 [Cohaesibacter sp. ES.047]
MKQQIVTLPQPIKLNGQDQDKVTIVREPIGREMGQYTAFDLMEGNIKALAYVLPKVTNPPLARNMVLDMSASNQMALIAGFNRFFDGMDVDGCVETVDTAQTETTIPATKTSTKPS